MRSYKLCVAITAVACIILQGLSSTSAVEKINSEELVVSTNTAEHHNCDEYKSKIWEKAFSNPEVMRLLEEIFSTAKELANDEVCSDTVRAFFNFIKVIGTSENTQYSIKMLDKMIIAILHEIDPASQPFKETQRVIERIVNNKNIRDLIIYVISQQVDLLKEPQTRSRLIKMIKTIYDVSKPSDNEILAKQKIQNIRGMVKEPTKMARGAISSVGRYFR